MPEPIHLLSPLRMAGLTLRNRIVAASVSVGGADDGGAAEPRSLPHYARAAGASGLVIAEPAWVTPQGSGTLRSPGMARDAHVAAWTAVTDAAHGAGGRIALPLWHAGRRAHPRVQPHGGWPVGPSAIAAPGDAATADGPRSHPVPRALETAEIPTIVEAFATAADRALRAGFDAVEIHAADDGLIEQFLRPDSNHRQDAYGGDEAGRSRLLVEIVDELAVRIGAGRLGLRLDVEQIGAAMLFAGRGLAWLHVVPAADDVPTALRHAFDGPIILGGAWPTETASVIMTSGVADAVVLDPTSRVEASPLHTLHAGPAHLRLQFGDGPGRFAPSPA